LVVEEMVVEERKTEENIEKPVKGKVWEIVKEVKKMKMV
jgi:hypothetical protein